MPIRNLLRFHFICFAITIVVALAQSSWAATESRVYSFSGGLDGSNPASQLTFDAAGNAYGTTVTGGSFACGTVFQLTPTGGGQYAQSVLHSFDCFGGGKNPYGGVTLDAQGNLYGTTVAGGSGGVCSGDGCGVVYKLTRSGGGWTENVLYSFQDAPDAAGPGGAVVFDRAGNLLGTAPDGGAYAAGAVYELSQTNGHWTERVIHDFTGGADGAIGSLGRLLPDAYGNFYGVTELGGTSGAGTVFKLIPGSGGTWQLNTRYAFQGQPDAAFPYGGLIADSHGNLYGTTYYGGANGAGAVFRVGPGAGIGGWRDAVLYSFQGGADGAIRPALWSSAQRASFTGRPLPAAMRVAIAVWSLPSPRWAATTGAKTCFTPSVRLRTGPIRITALRRMHPEITSEPPPLVVTLM